MLTQLAIKLLSNVLAGFVKEECFSPDLLQVGIWSGHVELTNLELKEDILDLIGLPIGLRYARIGSIDITVPWKFLGLRPVKIIVEDIYVLAYAKYEWDAETMARRREARKLAQVQASYAAEQPPEQKRRNSGAGSGGGGGASLTELLLDRVLNSILDSLQVEVRNVHLRFEDLTSSPTQPYCLGLTLEGFSLGSMSQTPFGRVQNPNAFLSTGGGRVAMPGSSEQVTKLVQLRSLSVYCNPIDDDNLNSMALHVLDKDSEIDLMLTKLVPGAVGASESLADRLGRHRFILHPTNMLGEFLLDKRDVVGGRTRVVVANCHVQELKVTLEDHLLRAMVCLSAGLIRFKNMDELGLDRPTCSVKEDVKAWWRYAYRVVLMKIHEQKSKWDFDDMMAGRKDRLLYLELWTKTRRRMASNEASLMDGSQQAMEEWEATGKALAGLERRLSTEKILAYRRMGDAQLAKEGFKQPKTVNALSSWQQYVVGGTGSEIDSLLESQPEYVSFAVQVEASLSSGVVSLAAGKSSSEFMRLTLQGLVVRAGAEGTDGPKFANVSLQNLTVLSRNMDAEGGSPSSWWRPTEGEAGGAMGAEGEEWQPLLCRRGQSAGPLFRVEVELCPIGSQYQALVKLDMDKTEVCFVPEAPWLASIQQFLDLPDMADSWAEVETLALAQVYLLQEEMPAKLEYILRTHFRARLDVSMKGPLLRLLPPSNPDMSPAELWSLPEIHCDMGHLTLTSVEHGSGPSKPAMADEDGQGPPDDLVLDGSTHARMNGGGVLANGQEGKASPVLLPPEPPDVLPSPASSPRERAYDDNLYDVYRLDIQGIRVFVAPRAEPGVLRPSTRTLPLLDPLHVTATVYNSRLPADPGIMRFRLHLHISDVHMRLSEAVIRSLARLGPCYLKSKERAEREMERLRLKVEDAMRRGTSMTRLQSFVRTNGSLHRSSISGTRVSSGSLFSASFKDAASTEASSLPSRRSSSMLGRASMLLPSHSPDRASMFSANEDDFYSIGGFDDAASVASYRSNARSSRGQLCSPPLLPSSLEDGVDLAHLALNEAMDDEHHYDSAEEGDDDLLDYAAYAEADAAAPLSREASGPAAAMLPALLGKSSSGGSGARHLSEVVDAVRAAGRRGVVARRRSSLKRSLSEVSVNRKHVDATVQIDSVRLSISRDQRRDAGMSPSSWGGGGGEEEHKGSPRMEGFVSLASLGGDHPEAPLLALTVLGVGLTAYQTARCVRATFAVEDILLESVGDHAGTELRLMHIGPHSGSSAVEAGGGALAMGPSLLASPSLSRYSLLRPRGSFDAFGVPMKPPDLLAPPAAIEMSLVVELDPEQLLPFRELRSDTKLGIVSFFLDQRPVVSVLEVLEPLVSMSKDLSQSMGTSPPRPHRLEPPPTHPTPAAPETSSNVAAWRRLPRVNVSFEMKSFRATVVGAEASHPRAALCLTGAIVKLYPSGLKRGATTCFSMELEDMRLAIDDAINSSPVMARKASPTSSPHCFVLEAEVRTTLLFGLPPSALRPTTPNTAEGAAVSPLSLPTASPTGLDVDELDVTLSVRLSHIRFFCPACALLRFARGVLDGPLMAKARQEAQKLQQQQQPQLGASSSRFADARGGGSPARPATSGAGPSALPSPKVSFTFVAAELGFVLPIEDDGQNGCPVAHHGLTLELGRLEVGGLWLGPGKELEGSLEGSDWSVEQVAGSRHSKLVGLAGLAFEGREQDGGLDGELRLAALTLTVDDAAVVFVKRLMEYVDGVLERDLPALLLALDTASGTAQPAPPVAPPAPRSPARQAPPPLPFQRLSLRVKGDGVYVHLAVPKEPSMLLLSSELVLSLSGISLVSVVELMADASGGVLPRDAQLELAMESIGLSLEHHDHRRAQWGQVLRLLHKDVTLLEAERLGGVDEAKADSQPAASPVPGDEEDDDASTRSRLPALLPSQHVCMSAHLSLQDQARELELAFRCQPSQWTVGLEAARAVSKTMDAFAAVFASPDGPPPSTATTAPPPPPAPSQARPPPPSAEALLLDYLSGRAPDKTAALQAVQRSLTAMMPFQLTRVALDVAVSTQSLCIQEEPSDSSTAPGSQGFVHSLVLEAGLGLQCQVMACYEVEPGGSQLLAGLEVQVDVSGVDWQVVARRTPRQPLMVLTGGVEAGLPSEDDTLVSPLAWDVRVDVRLPLSDSQEEAATYLPVLVTAEIKAIEACVLLDSRSLEHLATSTLLPIADVFSGQAAGAASASTSEAESARQVPTSEDYFVHKVPIATPEAEPALARSRSTVAPSALEPATSAPSWPDVSRLSVEVELERLHVTVVDNLCSPSLPLLSLSGGPVTANLEGADGMLMGKIRLRLQSDAFNRRLVLWEPLLEPWSLRVELALGTLSSTGTLNRPGSRSSQSSAAEEAGPEADDRHDLLSVQVTATEVLQLNVTESFLETLLDSTSALSQASKAAGPASALPPPSMPPSAPSTPSQRSSVLDHQSPQQPPSTMNLYWIRNDTGVLLHYRLEGHDSANGWRTVRPGYHEVLSSSLPLYQDGKHKRRRTVTLSLQRPGQDPWRPLTHVSYHDERTVLHSLEARGRRRATAPIAVVTEVARTAGVKVLRVRSTAMLQNSCPLPVHVALRTPAQYGVIQWESSIEEGEEVPVPLYLAGLLDASLSLRMGSGRPVEVLMPSPQPDPETPDDDCLFLDMTVKGDKGKPTPLTYCCMRVRRGVNSQGQRSETITSDVRLISFNPPFVMGNFLPVPASFEIGMVPDRSYSPSKRGSDLLSATPLTLVKLRPGETFAWYGAASDRHTVTLKMKLTGSLWSKEVLIKPRFHPGAVEDLTVELQEDKAGPVLKAVAELAWDGRMRVLSVYVPFWLLNATTMGISYAHEKESTAEGLLAGQRGSKGGPSSTAILPSSEHPLSTQPSRPKGLLALLEAPPGAQSRTDVLVSRAQDHLIMAGFSSYSAKARQSFTRLRIRLDETAPWSKPFTLLPGASEGLVTTLELEDRPPPGALRSAWSKATRTKPRPARALGLSVSMWSAGGVFHRTRIVTVSPRLILVNAFGRGLEVRQDVEQASGLAEAGITLFTAQRAPLYWADGRGPRFLRVRIREFGWEWSGKFSPDVEGDTTLRLRNTHNDVKCFMQVRVTLQEPSFIVSFRREPVAFAPYRIENRTLETVWFGQVGVPLGQEVLLPYHTCAYAWDEPSMDHVLELERQATADGGGIGGRREAMGRTDFNPIKVKAVEVRGSHLMLDVVTRGAIRVLVITDSRLLLPYRQSSSVTDLALLNGDNGGQGPRRARSASTVDSDRAQGGSSSKPPPAPPAIMHVNVSAAGLGISLINSVPQELLYTSILRIQASFTAQPGGSLLRVAVGHLQVDDQTVTTTSPIVFIGQQDATTPPPPAISASSLGTMEARSVERPDGTGSQQLELVVEQEFGHDRILFIRDIRVGLVPFYLRLDGNLVASLIRLATNVLASALFTEQQHDSEAGGDAAGGALSASRRMPTLKRDVSLSRATALPPQLQQHLRSCLYSVMQRLMPPASRAIEEDWQKVFIDSLAVDPIRINVSFRASSMVSNVVTHLTSGTSEQHRFFKAILDVITSVVSKVEDAPLRFSALRLEHLYVGELSARGVNHYLGEVKWQAYVLLGTLAAFGNPVSALANVSTGVRDFVFEPAKALSEGNLWHFYQGVYRGSHSLVTRLLLTSVESVRAVVSSGHAAILPLVMLIEDDGALTTHGSLQGMVHGFRALLSEPIRGLKAGGMSGFRNGLARGIISVGLRPLLGMLDDIIEICQMFTTLLDPHLSRTAHLSRVRPPRLFRGRNAALEVYSREANLVNDVLSRLCKGEFWREGYVWYDVQDSRRRQGGHCVVVTGKRVLYVRIYHRPRRYVLEWQVPLASLLHMDVEEEVEDLKVELHFFPTPALGVGEPGGWSLVGSSTRHKRAVAEAEGTYGTSQPRAATLGFQGVGGEGLGGMGLWLRRSIADSHPGLRIGHRSFVVPGKGRLQHTERRVRELVRGIVAKRKGVKVSCPWPLDGGSV